MGKVAKLLKLTPTGWHDLARAAVELALANRQLRTSKARDLVAAEHGRGQGGRNAALSPRQRRLVERVAYAVPALGLRVPWRSDCLVQALAARRWLAGHDVSADLCIGVRKPGEAEFFAHAWLKVGETIVTGGDISGYVPLIAPQEEHIAALDGRR